MALPATFTTPEAYFQSCVEFLKSHSWIYQNANTCFLKMGTLENLTQDEKHYFCNVQTEDLNDFPYVSIQLSEAPITLRNFRKRLKELIPQEAFEDPLSITMAELPISKKMNPKKQHEISRLAHMIHELCTKNEILIDFGAGLGYLSEILFQKNTQYRILGLEADLKRVETARKRQASIMPSASNSIVYKQQMITENSAEYITQRVQEMLQSEIKSEPEPKSSWSIIGLHACADLTITSMRLFFALPSVRHLIIMPCCYHKLEMLSTHKFRNFPLSKSLQSVVDISNDASADEAATLSSFIFNRPFLRLACQQTLARWHCCSTQKHTEHGKQMWLRAVAEAILDDVEMVFKRKQKLDTSSTDERLTFNDLCATYELKSKLNNQSLVWLPRHERKFNEVLRSYPAGAKLAEGLTCLQTTMQKLCENIVLYDRLCYMQECADSKNLKLSMRFVKLMNEKLSPRCYVLVVEKLD